MKRFVIGGAAVALLVAAGWAVLSRTATAEESKDPLKELRKSVRSANAELMMDGKYACCISPGCSFCTLAVGACPCRANVLKGKPVCPTCKGGWAAGYGAIGRIDAAKVKMASDDHLKKMYRARKKAFKDARK